MHYESASQQIRNEKNRRERKDSNKEEHIWFHLTLEQTDCTYQCFASDININMNKFVLGGVLCDAHIQLTARIKCKINSH